MSNLVWVSPLDSCQLCDADFAGVMYDAALKTGGWANICHSCFGQFGRSLGIGLGQRYELRLPYWHCTAGAQGLDDA